MLWRTFPSLEAINQLGAHTAAGHLGITFVEAGDDYLAATMPVDHRTRQPLGLLHGGASVVLAETLGSIASTCCINYPREQPVGIEISASHLRSVRSGLVRGVVRPLRVGRRTHVWEVQISDETGQLVCIARLTVAVIAEARD